MPISCHVYALTLLWHLYIVEPCTVVEMASEKKSLKSSPKGGKSNEEIFAGFQTLRNEQRIMASKLSEMEMELNEHK